ENGPIVQTMDGFGHVVNLFSLCYDKGSRVVGMIEDRLGEAAFLDFMRGVYRKYQFRILRVADFQRELEAYTGRSWDKFFAEWLYGPGVTDWAVEKVKVNGAAWCRLRKKGRWSPHNATDPALTHVTVWLEQREKINEQTVLGIGLPGRDGYPI